MTIFIGGCSVRSFALRRCRMLIDDGAIEPLGSEWDVRQRLWDRVEQLVASPWAKWPLVFSVYCLRFSCLSAWLVVMMKRASPLSIDRRQLSIANECSQQQWHNVTLVSLAQLWFMFEMDVTRSGCGWRWFPRSRPSTSKLSAPGPKVFFGFCSRKSRVASLVFFWLDEIKRWKCETREEDSGSPALITAVAEAVPTGKRRRSAVIH